MIFKETKEMLRLHGATIDDKGSFFPARIKRPELARHGATNHLTSAVSQTGGKWSLCGDVSSELFLMITSEVRMATALRLMVYSTPLGARYAIISHQLLAWTHRFVLPLYEPSVLAMLIDLQNDGSRLIFSLGNECGAYAALLDCPLEGAAFTPLLACSNLMTGEKLRLVLAEFPSVITAFNNPLQVPSLVDGVDVTDVSVSVVLPAFIERFYRDDEANG